VLPRARSTKAATKSGSSPGRSGSPIGGKLRSGRPAHGRMP
jgi:hypothetical protein